MSLIQLFIATSINGFIARENGSIDWLESLENPDQIDHGYMDFLAGVDTVIMGRTTYEQVLDFGVDWPYVGKQTYVITRQSNYATQTPTTQVLSTLDEGAIQHLKAESQQNIWLVGGGEVNAAFLRLGAVDEMIISVIPVVLGGGRPLFAGETPLSRFTLQSATPYTTGVVNLHYRKSD